MVSVALPLIASQKTELRSYFGIHVLRKREISTLKAKAVHIRCQEIPKDFRLAAKKKTTVASNGHRKYYQDYYLRNVCLKITVVCFAL